MTTVEKLARVRDLVMSGRAQEIREAARVTRPELGVQVGASAMTISRWEAGENLPHGKRALRLLRALEQLECQLNGSKANGGGRQGERNPVGAGQAHTPPPSPRAPPARRNRHRDKED